MIKSISKWIKQEVLMITLPADRVDSNYTHSIWLLNKKVEKTNILDITSEQELRWYISTVDQETILMMEEYIHTKYNRYTRFQLYCLAVIKNILKGNKQCH